ncbi:hypothetical protein ABZP36_034055 [Zizania latifolia]
MEVSMEAGNAGEAAWLDDDGRPRRTGTLWTASAHIITAVIGSGVLSLAWAIAQLGWVAGPAVMLLFAVVIYYTSTLLAECYRTGDLATGKRNYTYMDAVRANLGGAKVTFCGIIQYANLVGVAIGYTIASSISMRAIRRADCFHENGHADPCHSSSNPYMILFGAVQILFSQIPDFDQIWWLSIVAAVMSFTYSGIGLSLGIAQTICMFAARFHPRGVPRGSARWISLKTLSAACLVVSIAAAAGSIADVIDALKVYRPFSG